MIHIDTVTVIGANGTMGRNVSAIFASFGNSKVYLISRTKEKSIEAKNKAYLSVKAESIKERMIPADYNHIAECVAESDLIFEACAEKWDVKREVHMRISEALQQIEDTKYRKIICSGTSGLSITEMANFYEERSRTCFVGMHFFNPPYSMTLCELVPTKYTDKEILSDIKEYLASVLYRTVVEVMDFPAFLGNRIGFRFINEAMQMAEKYKYNGGIDYIDAILGPFSGRAMPPLATADFVGLDVHKAIVDNLYKNTRDFDQKSFELPQYVNELVNDKKFGKKSGAGLYKMWRHDSGMKMCYVYDISHKHYREKIQYSFPFVEEMVTALKVGDYDTAFRVLIENRSQEADICCQFLLKYILYSLKTAELVGYSIHSADDVMAAGFNWCPPLAMVEIGRAHV